ncbi:hypothetical protein GE09DRAFT_646072 [Coniochaeta sp. 2T2.1]|nr:hypothetical protein GE09DRAFT_646072 [Coniochaeta sp. 2T2.1]
MLCRQATASPPARIAPFRRGMPARLAAAATPETPLTATGRLTDPMLGMSTFLASCAMALRWLSVRLELGTDTRMRQGAVRCLFTRAPRNGPSADHKLEGLLHRAPVGGQELLAGPVYDMPRCGRSWPRARWSQYYRGKPAAWSSKRLNHGFPGTILPYVPLEHHFPNKEPRTQYLRKCLPYQTDRETFAR